MQSFVKYFLSLSFLSCNLELNTVDPQVSASIEQSKDNNFFLQEYSVIHSSCQAKIREVWVEFTWKNALVGGKLTKQKLGGQQLLLRFEDYDSTLMPKNKYLILWEIEESEYGSFGSSNGNYDLQLKKGDLPNKFHIVIRKIDSLKTQICEIILKKDS
jgi:hypothetical protein